MSDEYSKHSDLEKQRTVKGHLADDDQPTFPVVHRRLANPAPLGLLSFATSIFLISLFGVNAKGVATPNVLIGSLLFFGGLCQFVAGIFEFVLGNTFGATVFPAYAGFNLSYALIYLPGSGIMDAYTDKATGELTAEFPHALGLYLSAWLIISVIFTIAATRSSWVLLLVLVFFDLEAILLIAGYVGDNDQVLLASRGVGFVVAFFCYWAGTAGLWGGGVTRINLPTGSLRPKSEKEI